MKKILSLILLLLISNFANAENLYNVTAVTDGDTFTATDGNIKFRVRIVGLDAPEKAQPYGKLSGQKLQELILGKSVKILPIKQALDGYNRILAQVFVSNTDVAYQLIQEGLAYYYRPTCKDFPADSQKYNFDPRAYIDAESKAQKLRRGLWSSDQKQMLPCAFRKTKKH